MTHRIDKRVTVTVPIDYPGGSFWQLLHRRSMLIDEEGGLWVIIEKGDTHDTYALLVPSEELLIS